MTIKHCFYINYLPDMESNDLDDQVRKTKSDVEPIDIEYLLEDNQRVVNFLTAGTQEDKQRFIDLLRAKLDREWKERKAEAAAAGKTPCTSQTGYICLRSGSRDRLFPHTLTL